jgi:IS30 family transposase
MIQISTVQYLDFLEHDELSVKQKNILMQQYSEEYIKEVETEINSKPRKILGYTTALILFTYYLNEVI